MTRCDLCQEAVNARKPNVCCAVCKAQFHPACISDVTNLVSLLNSVKGLSWKCENCIEGSITVDNASIHKMLDEKVEKVVSAITDKITQMRSEVASTTNAEPVASGSPLSYAAIVKNRALPAVIIQPKDSTQKHSQTKSDIGNTVDPIVGDLHLCKVKNIKGGGVLIGCKSRQENEKIRKAMVEKMGDSYVVKELHGVSPRVRVVGMTDQLSEDALLTLMMKCNRGLFSESSEVKIVKIFPTKKNADIYQCILQLDMLSYNKVIKARNIFVGFNSCYVYDAIEIYRCYNCNAYHHSSKSCEKPVSCPLCSQNHDLKSCTSSQRKCSNCHLLNNQHSLNIDTNHAVWEKEKCAAYERAVDKLRDDILATTQ